MRKHCIIFLAVAQDQRFFVLHDRFFLYFCTTMIKIGNIATFLRVTLLAAMLGMVLTACDDEPEFRITGIVDGLGTRHISMIYAADGELHTVTTTAIDGKFSLTGSSRDYTLVELLSPQGKVFSRLLAKNGQNIKCRLDIDDPYKIELKGSKPTEQWAKFLTKNHDLLTDGTGEMINGAIEEYVSANPGNILSSLMLLTMYDATDNESKTSTLFASLDPEARPDKLVAGYRLLLSQNNNAAINTKVKPLTLKNAKDSVERFVPLRTSYTLIYFSSGAKVKPDTINTKILSAYDRYLRRNLRVMEISFANDSAQWRRSIENDTLKWARSWVPGGAASPAFYDLSIPRVPYFILSDSIGNQVYRGSSISIAIDSLDNRLSTKRK